MNGRAGDGQLSESPVCKGLSVPYLGELVRCSPHVLHKCGTGGFPCLTGSAWPVFVSGCMPVWPDGGKQVRVEKGAASPCLAQAFIFATLTIFLQISRHRLPVRCRTPVRLIALVRREAGYAEFFTYWLRPVHFFGRKRHPFTFQI